MYSTLNGTKSKQRSGKPMISRKIKPPQNPPAATTLAKNNPLTHRSQLSVSKEAAIEHSPARSMKKVTPIKASFRSNRQGMVVYAPTPAPKATECIDYAM